MTEILRCESIGQGVTQLTLNRVPVNALNPDFLMALDERLGQLATDAETRAVLITSGLSVFSAGLDLKEAQAFSTEDQTAVVDCLNTMLARLYAMPKPVITAVNGAAIAGGLFFVLASDYAVARDGTKFGLTEVRVGVNFPIAPLEVARAALAPSVFRRLLLGGRNVDATAACESGIVDEVVGADELMPRARDVAADYATVPPLAFARVKEQMRSQALRIINDAIDAKSDPTRPAWFSTETRDAMNAMLQAVAKK